MTPSGSSTSNDHLRILIVRLSSMGDVVHALPAVAALRGAFPNATIGWLIEERWSELLCTLPTPRCGSRSAQRPLVDVVHAVTLKQWRRSLLASQTWERIAASLSDLRAAHYDVALDLQGAIRSAIIGRWSGAPVLYGPSHPREIPASLWYTRKVATRGAHVVEQYSELAEALIGRSTPILDAVLPYDPNAAERVDRRLREKGIREFVILSPAAGWGAKQWPAERYGKVAQRLGALGVHSIINYGPGEEPLAGEAEAASAGAAEAMSFSIGELIALTRLARLFIGGDTGPMHLASALNVPVVALFGPTDPARTGPFRTQSVVLRNSKSPDSLSHRHEPDPGLLEITVDEVVAVARKLVEVPNAETSCG
jgi:heptosyltransferase I